MKLINFNKIVPYMNKYGVSATSKRFNISKVTLYKKFKAANIKTVSFYNIPKFNINFFQKIDTEEKVYWLGFIYADGNIGIKRDMPTTIRIELKRSDKNHLEKFKTSLSSNKKIEDYSRIKIYKGKYYTSNTSLIRVESKKMAQDLIKLGCIPAKSLVLKFPNFNQVPADLIRHFIRGYFDGDGGICKTATGYAVYFVSTYMFLSKLSSYFRKIGTSTRNISLHKNKITGQLTYRKKRDIVYILNILYNNCNIYLDRKFELYKEYIGVYNANNI